MILLTAIGMTTQQVFGGGYGVIAEPRKHPETLPGGD